MGIVSWGRKKKGRKAEDGFLIGRGGRKWGEKKKRGPLDDSCPGRKRRRADDVLTVIEGEDHKRATRSNASSS